MLDLKQAVKKAMKFVAEIYAGDSIANIRLEEVDFDHDQPVTWLVTVSFERTDDPSPLPKDLFPDRSREYKLVGVEVDSGEVSFMKQRVFQ